MAVICRFMAMPPCEVKWLAERFEAHRTYLRGGVYRLLGSLSEADDAVQEGGCG
jgi:DNA-directed RNA polymerase specialized sigma24 family protein